MRLRLVYFAAPFPFRDCARAQVSRSCGPSSSLSHGSRSGPRRPASERARGGSTVSALFGSSVCVPYGEGTASTRNFSFKETFRDDRCCFRFPCDVFRIYITFTVPKYRSF